MSDKKLFIVEFGEPSVSGFLSLRFGPKPIYVIAKDYNEAATKAQLYMEAKKANMPPKSILDFDGSLNNTKEEEEEIKIVAVRLASDEIIW
jgi:hypothetical protein